MSYDPRSIAFLAEVLYPPISLQPEKVQQIHNALYAKREVSYQNFQVAQDGIHLTNPPTSPGAVSAVTFLPDRLIVREELRSTTVEDFATRLVNVTGVCFQSLGIHATMAQQFAVRSLITPRRWDSSTQMLGQGMLGGGEDALRAFGRPIGAVGMRFTFPQVEGHPEMFNLRLETWTQDPRSVWIENTGSFPVPTTTENLPTLSNHLFATYRFLTQKACAFLAQFDER